MKRLFLIAATLAVLVSGAAAEKGFASWYGHESGSRRADGKPFNPESVTCAHKTLPMGTWIKVTDIKTGKSIKCAIRDRGPYVRGRIVDLSLGAAKLLGIKKRGITQVVVRVLN